MDTEIGAVDNQLHFDYQSNQLDTIRCVKSFAWKLNLRQSLVGLCLFLFLKSRTIKNNFFLLEVNMNVDLNLNADNLYREESFTDFKVGAIRKLTPVKKDGSEDASRNPVFMGQTQLMSPEGPIPVSCLIEGTSLEEVIEKFPGAIQEEIDKIIAMAQKSKQKDDSRIIMPGQ
jgi:hypothetical protein